MSIEVRVPSLPESVADATLISWHKRPGDPIKRGENLIDLETDKVVLEVPAPVDGVLAMTLCDNGETVTAGQPLAVIEPAEDAGEADQEDAAPMVPETPGVAPTMAGAQPLGPSARRALKEHGLAASEIAGTGKGMRITREDVERRAAEPSGASTPAPRPEPAPMPAAAPAPVPPAPVPSAPTASTAASTAEQRPERRVAMTRLRARIAERLVQAQHSAAILTTFNEVDLQAVTDIRQRHRKRFEQAHEVRLGLMSFFVKACVDALKRFPVVNASVDGQDIVYHGYFDIGIAVGSPRGLVVPILRDVDQLSFAEIERAVTTFGERAQTGNLSYEDLTGGTFTVSNGGIFGSMLSTPILNPPQSAILGMHKVQRRPVAVDDDIVVRPMMYLALSYDHRIIDGREAVQFLVHIKALLEDPTQMLLEL